jgi:hypothetical protein
MRSWRLLLALAAALARDASPLTTAAKRGRQAPGPSYVGVVYPPLPVGLSERDGELVGEPLGGVDFSVSWVSAKDRDMLWLSRSAPGSQEMDRWQVLDVVALGRVGGDDHVALTVCSVGGVEDPEIVALARYEDKEVLKTIKRAWRARRAAGKLEPIPVKGVSCVNEGAGD